MQYFALKLAESGRSFTWYPTDADPRSLASQRAYVDEASESLSGRVAEPLQLTLTSDGIAEDGTRKSLPDGTFDLIVNCNMIHISPWSATEGLMKTAGRMLKAGGVLYLYGPYRVGGKCVESNE